MKTYKTLGILGGMGPESTAYFFNLLTQRTPAQKDEDHIPTVIYSNSKTPNRQNAVKTGEYTLLLESLKESIDKIVEFGANYLVIPCNMVHYFVDMLHEIPIPIIHIIQESVNFFINQKNIDSKLVINPKIGLFATDGVISTKVYDEYFKNTGMEIVNPGEKEQQLIQEIIWEIKATGKSILLLEQIRTIIANLRKQMNVGWIILGCTELSVLFQDEVLIEQNLFDPLRHLVDLVIQYALGK